jgi:uncharacterized protein Yka (UPF0111/DUF47 family)
VRLRLLPGNTRFFELFDEAGRNVATAGAILHELLRAFPETGAAGRLRACEEEGDRITRELVELLNGTFVTPFDREDVYALASALDDVVDHLDEAGDELVLYGVRSVRPEAVAQAAVAARTCELLAAAVGRLQGFAEIRGLLGELDAAEEEGDALVRAAIAGLFAGDADALAVIRWKDIHEEIEEAVDSCQRAGHVLESIYLKNQ